MDDSVRDFFRRSRACSGDAAVWWLVALAALTAVVCVLVGGHIWHIGIPGEWTWRYYDEAAPWAVVMPGVVFLLLLCVTLALYLRKNVQLLRRGAVGLGAVLLLGFGVTMNVGDAGPFGFVESVPRTVIPWIGGYYTDALDIKDVGDYLKNYRARIADLTVDDPSGMGHLSDHPPGAVLFHYAVNRSMESMPGLAQKFLPADPKIRTEFQGLAQHLAQRQLSEGQVAGIRAAALLYRMAIILCLIFVYLIGRELYSSETGIIAAGLALMIPSLHLFGPYPDQLFPLLATGTFYAWLRALRTKRIAWAVTAGIVLAMGMFITLAFLAVVALIGAAALLKLWREAVDRETPVNRNAWIGLALGGLGGFFAASLLPTVLFGYDTIGVWKTCMTRHGTFAETFPRSYMAWTLFNPVEYILFAGIVVSALMAWQALCEGRRWLSNWREAALPLLPWALLVVLVALNFSGKNPGEVARLWMFMMPLAAVSAAEVLRVLDRGRGWFVAAFLAVAAVQLVVFRLNLNVLTLES